MKNCKKKFRAEKTVIELFSKSYKHKRIAKGFSLIEALIFLSIFVISVLTLYSAFSLGLKYSIENKKRLQAISLAGEEIEKMKNLGYNSLVTGTTENAEVVSGGSKYYVTTRITSFDDQGDGTTPADSISWDYLKVGVDVKWLLDDSNKMISMSAIIVPPVREEDANKGYMRLHVINQDGEGLPGSHVAVTKISTGSLVYSGNVNSSGDLFLTGLDPGLHKISISSFNNYYPIETLNETASFLPADTHPDISAKTLTERTLQTDVVSDLNIAIKDTFDNDIPNLGFDIEGGKYLGLENGTTPIYDFSDSVSDSDGSESFLDMSFGPYFFNFTDTENEAESKEYQFLWMSPISDVENKVILNADETLSKAAVVASKISPSLLVEVLDNADDKPIRDALVHVERTDSPGYDREDSTNNFGKIYFPLTDGQIINGDYEVTVAAGGYDEENKTVTVNGLTNEIIKLDSN